MKNKIVILLAIVFIAGTINGQFGVNVKGGTYIPVGELSDSYTTGFGGDFTLIYRSNPFFEIGITSGYSSYTADEDVLKERIYEEYKDIIDNINIDGTIEAEAPLTIIPLALNIKYILGNKKVKPYFFFEGGVFFYDLTTTARLNVVNDKSYDIMETTQTENSTMLGFGGGIQFRITKKLFFDVSTKWSILNNIKLVEADINEELRGVDKTVQTISILGGFNYIF